MSSWISKAQKRSWKFWAAAKLILEKKHILAVFRIIFQKIDIISDVIIAIAAVLKFFFYQFFCNITKYDCAKFHVKNVFLSRFMQGEALCATPWGMMRQKYPGTDKVKTFFTMTEFVEKASEKYFPKICVRRKYTKVLKSTCRSSFSW